MGKGEEKILILDAYWLLTLSFVCTKRDFYFRICTITEYVDIILFNILLLLPLFICVLIFYFSYKNFVRPSAKIFRVQKGSVAKLNTETLYCTIITLDGIHCLKCRQNWYKTFRHLLLPSPSGGITTVLLRRDVKVFFCFPPPERI